MAEDSTTSPLPAFGSPNGQSPALVPLPSASATPSVPRPKSRATSPPPEEPASGVGPEWLTEPYRSLCPAGLRGEGLMRWYLSVQQGEQLGRAAERANALGMVQLRGEIQGLFQLVVAVGEGIAEIVSSIRQGQRAPLQSGSPPPLPAVRPRAAARPPTDDDELFVPAVQPPTTGPSLVDEEEEQEGGTERFTGRPSAPPRLLNRDAKQVRDFARSRVPMAGVPMLHDQQVSVAEQVAEEWLRRWSEPGAARSSRWEGVIVAEIHDRLAGKSEELFR